MIRNVRTEYEYIYIRTKRYTCEIALENTIRESPVYSSLSSCLPESVPVLFVHERVVVDLLQSIPVCWGRCGKLC